MPYFCPRRVYSSEKPGGKICQIAQKFNSADGNLTWISRLAGRE